MDLVSSILPRVLRRRGLHVFAQAAAVSGIAERYLAKELPHHSLDLLVTTLKHGVLTIETKSSVAAQECQQMCADLLELLKRDCGEKTVTDIRLIRTKK